MEDPFFTVRDNVKNQVETAKVRFEKFQDLLKNTDTSTNSEFKEVRKVLVKDLRAADKSLKVLQEAVDMIDKNRSKYPLIKDNDLLKRKKFVEDMHGVLQNIKNQMDSPASKKKIEQDNNKSKRNPYDEQTSNYNALHNENDRFIKNQSQQFKEQVDQQDKSVEMLGRSVDKLHEISLTIDQELKEQNKMLDNLEEDIDGAKSRMDTVMSGLEKLLKTKDGCQIWTIVILALILVIIVALIIWT